MSSSFQLYAVCTSCQRMERLELAVLLARFGPHMAIAEIRRLVRCRVCRSHTQNIRIVYVGPASSASAFHYRE